MVNRYAENSAASFNAALQDLEDLYTRTGNAVQVITSGTLATTSQTIDMAVPSTSWRWVRLIANFVRSSVGFTPYLQANNDSSASYSYIQMEANSGGIFVGSTLTATAANTPLISSSFSYPPAFIDATIFLTSSGYAMIGSISGQNSSVGIEMIRMASFYVGGAVTSLQLGHLYPYVFGVGTTYLLQGVAL